MGITKNSIALTASTLRRFRCISAGSLFAAAAGADLQDFQLDLDARMTALADKNAGFAVGFRLQDGDNQYELYVDTVNRGGPGTAQLTRWANAEVTELTRWVTGSDGRPSRIGVRAPR